MKIKRLLIVDGYTDEPAGLGVPPYIDVYPREAYGAMKLASKDSKVYYFTIDEVRKKFDVYVRKANEADLVLVIAGALVPGRYLGGEPLRDPEELLMLKKFIDKPLALAGPAASMGLGGIGGSRSVKVNVDYRIRGRLSYWIYQAAKEGIDRAEDVMNYDYSFVSRALTLGAEVILQHPNMKLGNLVVEIETFKGCPRRLSGGCSFCLDVLKGTIKQRSVKDIVNEIEALYLLGARSFRLGRQSDILVYGSKEINSKEWPRPDPEALERLMKGIRSVAPSLMTLHIDNVNPGTVVRWPRESEEALKVIVEYHTPGDVAALGIESVDPKVVKLNNLKVHLDEAVEVIRIINKVGRTRGWNGLPHLLPGLNFIAGLPGESRRTWEFNRELLERIEKEGLLVRRVNVRKLSIVEGTKVSKMIDKVRVAKGYEGFRKFAMEWQKRMLTKVVPKGTVLYNVMVEKVVKGISYARAPGSYPLTIEVPSPFPIGKWLRVKVKKHHARSVVAEAV